MAELLVTGGAGFIGSHLARTLVEAGNRVTVVDDLSTGFHANIPTGCAVLIGDLADPDVLAHLDGSRFAAIFHLAGQSGGMPSFDDPVHDLESNTVSTLRVIDFARRNGVPRIVYASSMAVYGDSRASIVVEDDTRHPLTPYAIGKSASEDYLRVLPSADATSVALRLNSVYGVGQDLANWRQGMVSIFVGQAVSTGKIVVRGDSARFRDFIHVSDVVDAFLRCGSLPLAHPNAVFNVSTGVATTVERLLELIVERVPFPVDIEYSESTLGDQFGIVCSSDRLRDQLGWVPHTSLQTGLDELMEWALKANGAR